MTLPLTTLLLNTLVIIVTFERLSALTLLVPRVITNDPHHALAADHLALVTNLLNAGSNFHGGLSLNRTN
jgi:hypothetical protein